MTLPDWAYEAQEYIEEHGEPPMCPLGHGYGEPLGRLGRLLWWRCVHCGIHFNTRADD